MCFYLRAWHETKCSFCFAKEFWRTRLCFLHKSWIQEKSITNGKSKRRSNFLVVCSWKTNQNWRKSCSDQRWREWLVFQLKTKRFTNWCLELKLIETYWKQRSTWRPRDCTDTEVWRLGSDQTSSLGWLENRSQLHRVLERTRKPSAWQNRLFKVWKFRVANLETSALIKWIIGLNFQWTGKWTCSN